MRLAVIILNTLSILAALAILPVAFYIGIWGILGMSYGRAQDTVAGVLIMLAPLVITTLCVIFSVQAMQRGQSYAPVIACIPFVAAIVALIESPLSIAFKQ